MRANLSDRVRAKRGSYAHAKIFIFFGKIDILEKIFFVYPSGTRVFDPKLLKWVTSLIVPDDGGYPKRIPGS